MNDTIKGVIIGGVLATSATLGLTVDGQEIDVIKEGNNPDLYKVQISTPVTDITTYTLADIKYSISIIDFEIQKLQLEKNRYLELKTKIETEINKK